VHKVVALANDPTTDEDAYTLKYIGPAKVSE
jgi:hypothetical protein